MRKLLILLLPLSMFAEVYSDTIGLVQFASDDSVNSRKDQAQPGVVQATELVDSGLNPFAALTIGTPSGRRIPVQDRYALHRVPYENIDYPNFYFSLGDYTSIYDDYTVSVFTNFCVPGTGTSPEQNTYTHTFMIVPNNNYYITHIEYKKTGTVTPRPDLGDGLTFVSVHVTCVDGVGYVEASVTSQQDTKTYDIQIQITNVRAVRGELNKIVDDLTMGDYYFKDEYGTTSLGMMRRWVRDNYDKYKANLWSDYPAKGMVNLSANLLRFSRDFYAGIETLQNPNDTWTLYNNGSIALRVTGGATETNGTFRIIQIDVSTSDQFYYIYTTTEEGVPYAITCTDLTTCMWVIPSGQTTTLTTYDGESAYCIAVPKTDDKAKFFRAVAPGTGGNKGRLISDFPIYAPGIRIQDSANPNQWWAITVKNGTITAVSTNGPSVF